MRSGSRKRACWSGARSAGPAGAGARRRRAPRRDRWAPAVRTAPGAGARRASRPCRRAGACGARVEFDEIHERVSCLLIDEVAIERELPDERIDLPERERRRGPALEIPAQEAIGRDLELERRFRGRRRRRPGRTSSRARGRRGCGARRRRRRGRGCRCRRCGGARRRVAPGPGARASPAGVRAGRSGSAMR